MRRGTAALVLLAACHHASPAPPARPATTTTTSTTVPCRTERRLVKTAQDPAAPDIDAEHVRETTVAELVAMPVPRLRSSRMPPVETTVYRVRAYLTEYKLQADSDVEFVLTDEAGHTMIAEAPHAACSPASRFRDEIASARAAFDAAFPPLPFYVKVHVPVTVTGVGFWDRVHGQRGVAPNGIELHPVLAFSVDGAGVSK